MSVASPCINVCVMDPRSGYCEGCYRTIDEITAWSRASDDDKRRILQQLAERRAAHDLFDDDLRCESDR